MQQCRLCDCEVHEYEVVQKLDCNLLEITPMFNERFSCFSSRIHSTMPRVEEGLNDEGF